VALLRSEAGEVVVTQACTGAASRLA
jgi:hypothetical protein